jgi:hypothetical protein
MTRRTPVRPWLATSVRAAVLGGVLAVTGAPGALAAGDGGEDPDARDGSWPSADAAPGPDGGCGDLDRLGECQGRTLRSCVGGVVRVVDCAVTHGAGFTCRLNPPLHEAACVHEGPDAGGPQGGWPPDAGTGEASGNEGAGLGCMRPGLDGAVLMGAVGLVMTRRRRSAGGR